MFHFSRAAALSSSVAVAVIFLGTFVALSTLSAKITTSGQTATASRASTSSFEEARSDSSHTATASEESEAIPPAEQPESEETPSRNTPGAEERDEAMPELPPDSPVVADSPMVGVERIPFYSQLTDVSDPNWQGLACGVVALGMIIEHHGHGSFTSMDGLLQEGREAGAFLPGAGWIHQGLVDLSRRYGLDGRAYDLSHQSMDNAFAHLKNSLHDGPVIASVFYTFDPQSPIPHLAVINGVRGDTVYFNDPAEARGGLRISVSEFKQGWKKRYITIYPNTP